MAAEHQTREKLRGVYLMQDCVLGTIKASYIVPVLIINPGQFLAWTLCDGSVWSCTMRLRAV